MISKKRAIVYGIVLVIVTALFTSTLQIGLGNKVVVSKDLYEKYSKYNKMIGLEGAIKEDFYQKTKDDNLVNGAIKGMFSGLDDPYSQYYTEDEFKRLKEQTSGSFVGIGVIISPSPDDDYLTVVSPIQGSPAEKSGIEAGDKIVKVDGKNVFAKNSDEAISMIKGKEGTTVELTLKRDGNEFDVKVKREEIVSKSVEGKMLEDKIGYLRITSFSENTYKEFKTVLDKLKSEGMKGLILDVRDNGGGLLNICKDIADELIGEGTIVYTKDNKGNTEYLKSDKDKLGLPIAILTNGNSASASEILTGAIVDNKAGISIGTTTFGKGLVQSVRELKDGTGFKLTTAQYFTPNGDYINGKGIKPNIEEKNPEKQLDKAIDWMKKEIK
ncbi:MULTISPECIES: S41 family peptidase [Romboutsia]|uniref:Carboxy-terminal processing protease CtpA n=1 Tax=Romboutsia hominis TaxID=1507512 RepID=A0A2P2BMI7_9FIRM|nr:MULTISPECIES: S41 family peptidase [Romboutsia]MDB8806062.1 S41 family peptidase [Romboutsia sp. 1001216sp1]MDB8808366.1 S41 family peptidase [Romboutsia sp. 1001216sp1]MDB8811739.1 S41 family peptidase [Romboutsia sp. 1001216sp1]MDB8817355.1 S41 family peptidase [Romboutsia sp. 1001216sp1]MDB8820023.1 S41 family peptidase [Romboutsia sp. 1001216sp1]